MAVSVRPPRRPSRLPAAAVERLEGRRLLSTTYYVSNAGSDANPGTSADQPWQTAAMVNAAPLQPGDTVLFQRGGTWREILAAPADGAASSPITFGAYGDAAAARPLFSGSDLLDPASFAAVAGTTESVAHDGTVNYVFVDGAFLHRSASALTQAGSTAPNDPPTNIDYVKASPGSFYYDPDTATLYVNTGASLAGHTVAAAVRQSVVNSNAHSHLAFADLAVTDSAENDGGYGFDVHESGDVTVSDCDVANSGKHAFGVINTTGFVGTDLTAEQSAPDQGFGGASMIAYFVDENGGARVNQTAQFARCTYVNGNGAYQIVIAHQSGAAAIAALTLVDLVSLNGYGSGIYVDPTVTAAKVTIRGGHMDGGTVSLAATTGAIIDGLQVTGLYGNVDVGGQDNVVQNCLFTGIDPNYDVGHPAALIDRGTGDVVRFNTFSWTSGAGSAIDVASNTSDTAITGNVFACPQPIRLGYDGTSPPAITSDRNLFQPASSFVVGASATATLTFSQWQGTFDADSFEGDADFADAAAGNYSVLADSLAVDLVTAAPDASVTAVPADFAGNPRPYGGGYDAGAFELQQPKTVIVASFAVAATHAANPAAPGSPSGVTFTVTLSAPLTVPVTVGYTTYDGSGHAGTDYQAATGTLTFEPGQTVHGVRVFTTPTATNQGATFALGLIHPASGTDLSTGSATAAVPAYLADAYSFRVQKGQLIPFTDGAARSVEVRITGKGYAQMFRSTVGGDVLELLIGDTTPASTVTVTTVNGHTAFGLIHTYTPLGRLYAPTVDLTGDLTADGNIGSLTLGNVIGPSDITMTGTKGRVTVAFGSVTDTSVTTAVPISRLTATAWAGPGYGTISAPSIAALTVPGTFGAGLDLTKTTGVALPAARLGAVTGGTWTVAGRVGTVAAKSTSANWAAVVAGTVGSMATAGDMAGTFAAASVAALRVGGNLTGATVTLTAAAGKGYDLNALTVGGTVSGSTVRSAGSVGNVTVAAITGSTVFAGVAPTVTTLPTAAGDFASLARLNAFTITGGRGVTNGLTASNVAAATVGHVRVTRVQTDNTGTPFGFAAHALAAYADVEPGKKTYVWTARQGGAALTTDGDFKVRLL